MQIMSMQIIANDGIIIISFWNYIFFCCGSLLPINAPRMFSNDLAMI